MATMNASTTDRRHIPERRTAASDTHRSKMSALDWTAMVLLIIGGLNWGLIGLFQVDMVATLFGEQSALSRIVYVVVGLSALYSIYTSTKLARQR